MNRGRNAFTVQRITHPSGASRPESATKSGCGTSKSTVKSLAVPLPTSSGTHTQRRLLFLWLLYLYSGFKLRFKPVRGRVHEHAGRGWSLE